MDLRQLEDMVEKAEEMLTCPITLAVVDHPVEIGDGRIYSRNAVDVLFKDGEQQQSPITREFVYRRDICRSQAGHDLLTLFADLKKTLRAAREMAFLATERVAGIDPEVLAWLDNIPVSVNASDEPHPDEEDVQASLANSTQEDELRQDELRETYGTSFDEAVAASLTDEFKRRRLSDTNDRQPDFYSGPG